MPTISDEGSGCLFTCAAAVGADHSCCSVGSGRNFESALVGRVQEPSEGDGRPNTEMLLKPQACKDVVTRSGHKPPQEEVGWRQNQRRCEDCGQGIGICCSIAIAGADGIHEALMSAAIIQESRT